MMKIESPESNNIIYTRSTGTIEEEDMQRLLPLLKAKIGRFGKARWYYEMEDFHGWDLKAFWEDVWFNARHTADFEKIAMVGEKNWQEWMTKLMKPFTSAEVKYFDLENKEAATAWIKM